MTKKERAQEIEQLIREHREDLERSKRLLAEIEASYREAYPPKETMQ